MSWTTCPATVLLVLLASPGCGAAPEESAIDEVTLIDLDPDPGVVEVELVAGLAEVEYIAGKPTAVWAYRDGSDAAARGRVPGPMLEARQGDRVIVHFRSELPEETTVHWHGLRVPNASDGTSASQVPVTPGGTFTYEFTATDAGTFWYHPHMQADVQIEAGLYGPVIVRGGVEPDVAADRVLVLDDVKLEADGSLSTQTGPLDLMLGRRGNVLLVDGKAGGTLPVEVGSRERWRFVNAANGRYFNLRLSGHGFLVIGGDGGLLAEPYATETVLVAPGERYDLLVEIAGQPGATLALQTVHYDRGHDIPDPGPLDLVALELREARQPAPAALPAAWGEFAPLPAGGVPVRSFVLSEDEEAAAGPEFFINGERFPDVTPIDATQGDLEIWQVRNDSEMDHPFHLHGMFFQVLDEAGTPLARQGWKDTVNVPQQTTLELAVEYGTPGRWMFHCHILEHAERGMMGELVIAP